MANRKSSDSMTSSTLSNRFADQTPAVAFNDRAVELPFNAQRLPIVDGRVIYSGESLVLFEAVDQMILAEIPGVNDFLEHASGSTVAKTILDRLHFFKNVPAIPYSVHAMSCEDGCLQELAFSEVLNPSTCYHCFDFVKHTQGNINNLPLLLTSVASCHRNEIRQHEPGRLRSFSMREFVMIGERDFIEFLADQLLDRAYELFSTYFSHLSVQKAADVFYGEHGSAVSKIQRAKGIKKEIVLNGVVPISLASRNFHNRTLLDAYDLFLEQKHLVSACVAFGLDRIVLSLLEQFSELSIHDISQLLMELLHEKNY